MKLVENWHSAWRWLSVRLMAAAASVQISVLAFPDQIRQYIGDHVMHWLALFLLVAAAGGRLVDQGKRGNDEPKSPAVDH